MKKVGIVIVVIVTLYLGYLGGFATGTSVARKAYEKQQQPSVPGRFTITRYDDGKVVVFDSATGHFDTYLPQTDPPADSHQDSEAPYTGPGGVGPNQPKSF